jgi:hypothetical protein
LINAETGPSAIINLSEPLLEEASVSNSFDIAEEFTRNRKRHQNVTCVWDGSQLILQAQQVRRELLVEGKKHQAWKRLCQIPSIGPIRSAVLLGILQTPHRFRTKRQLWPYSGFGIETQKAPITVVSTGSCNEQFRRSRSNGESGLKLNSQNIRERSAAN